MHPARQVRCRDEHLAVAGHAARERDEQAGAFGHEPKRVRKLLVHKQEIKRLLGKLSLRGYTLVPLSVYFKQGRAKVELGLGRGKKRGDHREDVRREIDLREAREAMQRRRR